MKKNTKIQLIMIILSILFTLTICGAVSAADNTADNQTVTNLSTTNNSQSLPDPYVVETGKSFTSIQAAIDDPATLNGYHIIIQTGTYTEHITVSKSLTLTGDSSNPGVTIVDGTNDGRVFTISPGVTVILENMTIRNGHAPDGSFGNSGGNGGAILNQGTLTLNNVVITNSRAGNGGFGANGGSGGAIYNTGTFTLNGCTLSSNKAGTRGTLGTDGSGGAIYNAGNLNINGGQIYNNQANNHGSGIYTTGTGTVTIANGIIRNNANGDGIGIYVDSGSPNITGNQIYSNGNVGVYINGGSSSISGNTIRNNNQQGIYVNGGNPTINGNQIYSNTQQGIYVNSGSSIISGNNITSNSQQGIYINNGNPVITGNNIRNNTDDGIHVEGYSGDSTHPIQIHYNSIVNNSLYGLHVGYVVGGINVNATYNWWGTNSPSYVRSLTSTPPAGTNIREDYPDILPARVTYDPYLYLRITANPSTIYNGQTSTVTADLTRDNHNNVAPGTVPNGTPVNFSFQGTPLGTLNVNPSYTSNGRATTIFTANAVGTSHVNATVDSQKIGPANIVINPVAVVTMTKTSNGPVNVESTGTFTITVHNNGPDSAQNVVVNDALLSGFTAGAPSQGTYNSGTGVWTIGTLANGATVTLTMFKNIVAGDAGQTFTNTATETQSTYNPNPVQPQAASIYVPRADVQITKTSNGPVNVGGTGTFTITLHNYGLDTAHNVIVNDVLPSGFTAGTPSQGSFSGNTWTVGDIGSGSEVTLVVNGLITPAMAGTTITNTATETQDEYTQYSQTSTANIYVPSADIAVTKTASNPTPNVGQSFNYTITVTNNGPDTATGVAVTDLLPAGLNFVSATPSVGTYNSVTGLWTIGTLTNGANAQLIINAIPTAFNAGANVFNTAVKTAEDQFDPNPANDVSTAIIHVLAADLTISKSVDNVSHPGQTINYQDNVNYTLTVNNSGPDAAQNVVIKDTISSLLNFNPASVTSNVAFTYNWDSVSRVFTAYLTNPLNAGSTAYLYLPAQVLAHNQTVNNMANVTTTTYDPSTPDETGLSFNVPPAVDMVVNKRVQGGSSSGTWNYHTRQIFWVDVTNNGPDTATNVSVVDTLPTGLDFDHIYTYGAPVVYVWDPVLRTITWTFASIGSGQTYICDLYVNVTGHNTTVVNNASVNSTEYDWNMSNNCGNATVNIPPAADVAIIKDVNNSSPNIGEQLDYTIMAYNNGPDGANNVIAIDTIPAGLTYVGNNHPGSTTWDPVNHILTWFVGTLGSGNFNILHIFATVDASPVNPTITNTANITADQYDWNLTNNQDTETVYMPHADISLSKEFRNTSWNVINTAHYLDGVWTVIKAHNNGPSAATNVLIQDILPAGLIQVSSWIWLSTDGGNTWNPTGDYSGNIWTITNLPNGAEYWLKILTLVTQRGDKNNTANVTQLDQYDPTPASASATLNVPVQANVQITKTSNGTVNVGQTGTFTITVTNNGPDTAHNVIVHDPLPTGFTYTASPGTSYDPLTGDWTIGTLTNGASVTLTLSGTITTAMAGTTIINTATETQDEYSQLSNQATANITVPAAAYIDIYKEFKDSPWGNAITTAKYHDTIWAMVKATNTGPNVTFTTIKDILTGLNWTGNYRVYYGGNPNDPNNWILNDLTNPFDGNNWNVFLGSLGGNTKWLAIEVTVNQTGAVSNYAETTSQNTYPYNGYDSYNATLNVPHEADLSLHKEFRATLNGSAITTANYGDHIYGIIRATNNGPNNATNINIHDVYSGYDYQGGYWVSYDGSNWIYQDTTSSFNGEAWTIPLLGNGQSIWLAIAGPVEKTGQNAVTNTANETAQDQYHSGDWPGDSISLNVPPAAYLTVDKEFRATFNGSAITTAHYGDWIWTVLQAWNNGPDDVWAIIKDTPQAGLNLNSSGWYYSIDGGITWNLGDGLYSIYNSSTHEWRVWIPGLSESSAWYYLAIPTQVTQTGNLTNEVEQTWQDVYAPEPFDHNTVNLSVPQQADVYIITTVNKTNPTVGENILVTIKVGNNGPDTAQGVVASYTVPSGFEFVGATKDVGTYTYDPVTRTITWNLGDVPVGDPYMYVTLKAISSGTFDNTARISGETTYDPNTDNKASSVVINVLKPVPKAHAATIPLQHTGLPIAGLVLAVLAVFSGLVTSKKF